MALGGKRPGAGRKKGKKGLEQIQALKLMREMISVEFRPLMEAALDAAKGLYIYDNRTFLYKGDKYKGMRKVYKKAPDAKLLTEMLDRFIGKVATPIGDNKDGLKELTDRIADILSKPAKTTQ